MLQNGPIQARGSPYLGTAQPRDKQKLTPVAEPHQLSLTVIFFALQDLAHVAKRPNPGLWKPISRNGPA
jgi:hypothetical protein